jgi:hypothetical protein
MDFLSVGSVFLSVLADFTPTGSGSAFRMRIQIQEANRMWIRIRNTAIYWTVCIVTMSAIFLCFCFSANPVSGVNISGSYSFLCVPYPVCSLFTHTVCVYRRQCFGSGSALFPHLIGFVDPDRHSECGYGSRSVKSAKNDRKNRTENSS